MANKLVQQQMKNIVRSLNETDLEKLLACYESLSNIQVEKSCRMVSYKCYEATMSHKAITTNGYGRTEAEASNNCTKNFLEMVMEDDISLSNLIKSLKKGNESTQTAQARENLEKAQNINNTLALNTSYTQAQDLSNFDSRKELDALSKNIGNISMIGNPKPTGDAANSSQLEIDDILLKMMLEDGGNLGGPNNFRKSLPPQHPNGIDIIGASQTISTKTYSNSFKPGRASLGGSISGENDLLNNKKVLQESTKLNSGANPSQGNDKDEDKLGTRQGRNTPTSYYNSKPSSSSNKSFEQKLQYYRQQSQEINGDSNQKELYRDSSHHGKAGGGKCLCSCSEQLQRANLRIESLEKKLKLLQEENRMLKYLSEPRDKDLKSELGLAGPTKSAYEKLNGNYDLTPHDNYDDINEFPERDSSPTQNEKSRSFSLDTYAKKKGASGSQHSHKNPLNFNKENNESMEKKDIKKIVPRLKLEMIPNYHAKFSQTPNPLATQNQNIVGATKGYTQQALQNPSSTLYSQNSFESGIGAGGAGISKYLKKS